MSDEDRFTIIEVEVGEAGNDYPEVNISEPGHECFIQIWRSTMSEALDLAELFKIALEVYYERE